jgi:predicted nucleic acid-binding protein
MIKVVLDTIKILECALEAQASFIISGDKHLLEIKEYKGIKIISPKEFLNEIK